MSQGFLSELQGEVSHRASGGDGSSPDFRENVFTEYVMELLSGEVGIVENPVAVHYQGEIGRGQARINGYALADDDREQDTIDLFVAVYRGFNEPTKVLNKELEDSAKQAVRFFQGALATFIRASIRPTTLSPWRSASMRRGPGSSGRACLS